MKSEKIGVNHESIETIIDLLEKYRGLDATLEITMEPAKHSPTGREYLVTTVVYDNSL